MGWPFWGGPPGIKRGVDSEREITCAFVLMVLRVGDWYCDGGGEASPSVPCGTWMQMQMRHPLLLQPDAFNVPRPSTLILLGCRSTWAGRSVIRSCGKLGYPHVQSMIEGRYLGGCWGGRTGTCGWRRAAPLCVPSIGAVGQASSMLAQGRGCIGCGPSSLPSFDPCASPYPTTVQLRRGRSRRAS